MISRIILIFCFICMLFTKTDFDVVESNSQKWHGGRRETGSGTNYEIKLLTHRDSKTLKFSGIWIDKKYFDLKSRIITTIHGDSIYFKNDTLLISFTDHVSEIKEFNDSEIDQNSISPPYQYQGEALIKYEYKGKIKYAVIKKIKPLQDVYYP